jgi:hypothetical protein
MGPPAKKGFSDRQIMVLVSTRLRNYYNSAKTNEIHSLENMKRGKGLSLSSLSLLAEVARFGLLFSLLTAGKLV